jgi:hypothetical protein
VKGRLVAGALASLLIGIGLMVPFEHPLTYIGGVAGLFGFIVLGVFAVATPENLGRDGDEDR